ncbi:MAG: DUF4197 domain-containing protein [Burkholderiaceae bacterium]
MQRRDLSFGLVAALTLAWATRGRAAGLTESDAAGGVRAALDRGATAAVAQLGRPDGFLGNPKVRIALPGFLESGAKLLRMSGQGGKLDELVTAMNRAAESAVPQAAPLLRNAVKSMSVEDALRIVRGGDTAVTDFFAGKTREPLSVQFLPIVTRATERASLASKYNAVAGKASGFGLVKREDANLEHYVTGKALDGLYTLIGEEERKIRRDPVGTGSALLKRVFG